MPTYQDLKAKIVEVKDKYMLDEHGRRTDMTDEERKLFCNDEEIKKLLS